MGGKKRERVFEAMLGFAGKRGAGAGYGGEELEGDLGVVLGLGFAGEDGGELDALVAELEAGVRRGGAAQPGQGAEAGEGSRVFEAASTACAVWRSMARAWRK